MSDLFHFKDPLSSLLKFKNKDTLLLAALKARAEQDPAIVLSVMKIHAENFSQNLDEFSAKNTFSGRITLIEEK